MPTGYTAGVMEGKITSFPEFAKSCMRAFGATIHMRDEPSDAPYVPDEPSTYHKQAIDEVKKKIKELSKISEDRLFRVEILSVREEIKHRKEYIEKAKKNRILLEAMLKEVQAWKPPTKDHKGIKDFMIEQLTSTIDFDGKTDYWEKSLESLREKLETVAPESLKEALMAQYEKDLAYHKKDYKEDVNRSRSRNKWVEQLLNSLK